MLTNIMAPKPVRSRIHLLAAREAPVIVILQRKRTKLFHVITVDTETHAIDEGSWFRGMLYELGCDVSFDGKFMVYQARGSQRSAYGAAFAACRGSRPSFTSRARCRAGAIFQVRTI